MDIGSQSIREAVVVFDCCTFNPFKDFKTTKRRLKAKFRAQALLQPRVLQYIRKLQEAEKFHVSQVVPLACQSWGHGTDLQVLEKVEQIAGENPQVIVIFVTRDYGFCQSAEWHAEHSRVYICVLPRTFSGKTVDQYNRLEMMYIISIDVTHFLTQGKVTYCRLYCPDGEAVN